MSCQSNGYEDWSNNSYNPLDNHGFTMIFVESDIDPKVMRQNTHESCLTQESPYCSISDLRSATHHQPLSLPRSYSAPYGYPSPRSPEPESTCSSDAYCHGETSDTGLTRDCFMPLPVSHADRKDSGYYGEDSVDGCRPNNNFGLPIFSYGMDDTSFMPTFGQSGGVIPELKIEDDDCYRDNVNLNCSIKTDPTAANYGGVQVEAYRQHSMEDVKPLPMEVEPDSEVSDSESLLGPQENDDSDLDGSYRPGSKSSKATRTRTRIHHKSNVLSALPRASRITKSRAPRTTGQQCKTCKQRFPPAAMGCHMTTEHNETRAYPCVFHWAGCDSVFGAKNEWKRHVQSQHLKLSFWRCTQGACGNSSRGYQGKKANADFNRKDLFTSHLRRMHLVGRIKQAQKDQKGVQAAWEQDSQMKAKVTRGQPCNNSVCPAEGCEQRFEGSKGWDDRMEHIAKHLEERKDVQLDQGAGGVREWALRQGLVAKEGDAWRLLDQSQSHVVSDADADVDAD